MSHRSEQQPQDYLSPREIGFAIESPEFVLPGNISGMREAIHQTADVESVARRYRQDAGPLGFLDDEDVKNLIAAGVLLEKINDGRFPDKPWIQSDALQRFGIESIYSTRVMSDADGNDFNIRPSDPEGISNRLVLYSQLGIEPDQVLSPILGSGRDVLTVGSGDQLVYDKKTKRLLPESNNGHADGWIVKNPELSQYLAMTGFVADCPMVTLVFTEKDETGYRKQIATGMMHMGWQNIANGLDLAMAEEIQKQGFDPAGIFASVSPGARFGLKLPKQLITDRSVARQDFAQGKVTDMLQYGVKDASDEIVQFDNVQATVQLLWHKMGLKPENIMVSDRCTISDPNLHSYRRDKEKDPTRPQAGRLAVVSLPMYASNNAYWRDELFGNPDRNQQGVLGLIQDTNAARVYSVH